MNFYQSLQSNTTATFRPDDSRFSYPIVGKETPANPGRLERSMQDIVEPVIQVPGPSKHREPLVEVASSYHIEAHKENTSDTMERSFQQAAPGYVFEHSDSETDASVSQESRGTSEVPAASSSSPGSGSQTPVIHHAPVARPQQQPREPHPMYVAATNVSNPLCFVKVRFCSVTPVMPISDLL